MKPNIDSDAQRALQSVTLILLAGCPGAGKEKTGDELLLKHPRMKRIITSEVLGDEVRDGTANGAVIKSYQDAGKIVPDEFVIPLLWRRIKELYEQGCRRIILDGFPRTKLQMEVLAENAKIFLMCYLNLPEQVAIERMLLRGRPGETQELCEGRQRVFKETTLPVIKAFQEAYPERYVEIESTGTIEQNGAQAFEGILACESELTERLQQQEEVAAG